MLKGITVWLCSFRKYKHDYDYSLGSFQYTFLEVFPYTQQHTIELRWINGYVKIRLSNLPFITIIVHCIYSTERHSKRKMHFSHSNINEIFYFKPV